MTSTTSTTRTAFLLLTTALAAACDDGGTQEPPPPDPAYVLSSIVIDGDGNRTMYVQTISSIDAGPFDNASAIEVPGNGVVIAHGKHFFTGLTEEPTWVRYSVGATGAIEETGRLSLANTGAAYIDYGNAIVDEHTAVSVLSDPPLAVIWDPTDMVIKGEIDLAPLARAGYSLEVWTTIAHNGRVYIPGRWADWDGGRIFPGVSLTIIDPQAMAIVGTATDDRCASGGRVVFDAAGYGYVMGDGRTYSIQMFARAAGLPAPPDNCLLRIAPGATDFEAGYYYTIPSLTGGLQSITELDTTRQGSGVGFAKMFYEDQLPPGVEPIDFAFWNERAHKLWRIELTNPPTAKEVTGAPFSAIGFEAAVLDGKLYSGESLDGGATSEVFEVDAGANTATKRFSMIGYFYGLYRLER